jgi:hypothetical protein
MSSLRLRREVAAIEVDEIDIGDAVRHWQPERIVPDGLRETAGDQPTVRQADVRPSIDDRRNNRASRQ